MEANNTSDPLAALEKNGYNVSSFSYPIDLVNDPGESHFVLFYVNESSNTQFSTTNSDGLLTQSKDIPNVSRSPIPKNNDGTDAQPTINTSGNITNFKRPINRVSTLIALYMPPVISANYDPVWDVAEGAALGGAIKAYKEGSYAKILTEMGLGAARNLAEDAKDLLSIGGVTANIEDGLSFFTRAAANSHLEMLFKTIGFRKFQFEFRFTPRSEKEAMTALNIVKAFKFYSSPEVKQSEKAPKYFIFPAEWDIQFWSNGKENNAIGKISTCACTSVSVTYTNSNGFTSFRPGDLNGMPVEINLALQFSELEILTKARVLQGY